ncbi:MAG: L-threonylcarbamoyladenylate synthase [Pyrinomonadaceae bacterium]
MRETEEARGLAAGLVSHGGLIAFRTDTFYGLGADPRNCNAVSRVADLKGRGDSKPILLLISDAQKVLDYFAEESPLFVSVSERHWPGPLTLVGPARAGLPRELTGDTNTIGLRLPNGNDLRGLIRLCGGALTATSANRAGEAPARTAAEVAGYFPMGLDLILDGGEVEAAAPSTVLELTEGSPRLIREGAVSRDEILETLRCIDYGINLLPC